MRGHRKKWFGMRTRTTSAFPSRLASPWRHSKSSWISRAIHAYMQEMSRNGAHKVECWFRDPIQSGDVKGSISRWPRPNPVATVYGSCWIPRALPKRFSGFLCGSCCLNLAAVTQIHKPIATLGGCRQSIPSNSPSNDLAGSSSKKWFVFVHVLMLAPLFTAVLAVTVLCRI